MVCISTFFQFIKMNPKRIESIDLLRGHFLIAMIVDHLAFVASPSIWILYNGNGNLWVSAAEGFVFLASLMVGYLFVAQTRYTFSQISRKLLLRALSLYGISVMVTILTSLFLWGERIPLTGQYSILQPSPDILKLLSSSIFLQHRYGWVNILTLYSFLFLISPIIVFLFRRRYVYPVIAFSIILWLLSQIGIVREDMNGIYDLYSWQLLFVLGIGIGANLTKVRSFFFRIFSLRIFQITTVLFTLAIAFFSVKFGNDLHLFGIQPFSKGVLGIGRLLLFPIWLTGTYTALTFVTRILPTPVKAFYIWFGQHSLQIYVLHGAILTVLAMYKYNSDSYWINTMIIACVLLIILFFSILLSKQNNRNDRKIRI